MADISLRPWNSGRNAPSGCDCFRAVAIFLLTSRYELVETDDGNFGSITDSGEWTGLIGMLKDQVSILRIYGPI